MFAAFLHNPLWTLIIRVAQAVLSVILLGLAGATGDGGSLGDASALVVASAVFTWVVVAYVLLTHFIAPLKKLYHLYAIIALDGFLVIMWLCAWALSAARAAQLQKAQNAYEGLFDFDFGDSDDWFSVKRSIEGRGIEKRALEFDTLKGLLGACAGLGALIWLLFIGTLVLNVFGLLRGSPVQTTTDESHQMEEAKTQPGPQVLPSTQPEQQQEVQPQYNGLEHQAQPQYTNQEQYIQPQHAGHETYTHEAPAAPTAPAAPGETQYPPVAPPAPHN